MKSLPVLVERCLAHGIAVLPYELYRVLDQYERKKIPDKELQKLPKCDLEKYIKALSGISAEISQKFPE